MMKHNSHVSYIKETSLVTTAAERGRSALARIASDGRSNAPFEGWGPRLGSGLDASIR